MLCRLPHSKLLGSYHGNPKRHSYIRTYWAVSCFALVLNALTVRMHVCMHAYYRRCSLPAAWIPLFVGAVLP